MRSSLSDLEAVGFALAGFTFWVLADTSVKIAGNSNLPAYEILAFLGFFIVLMLVLRGAARHDVKAVWPKRPRRQLVRSCLDLANNICVVIALRHLPLTLFYILVFMSPMVITLLEAAFLRERLDWRRGIAVVSGFIGVVIAVDPFNSSRQGDWIGFAACMVCVACFSVNMVWSRVITQTETPESLTFLSGALMAATGFGCMLWHAEPLTTRLTLVLVAMGLFCGFGSICFFIALKHTSAANVSQYHYTQLVSGALVTYLIWREKPSVSTLSGGAVIIVSGIYIAFTASRERVGRSPFPLASPE
ncbi:MAG TPA: DMT family transporter [Terracidiphilus sp.]|jgi:drug/metabolite transporter (DMT)-like permease